MDKALKPERFDGNTNTNTAEKEFNHWLQTFEYFLEVLPQTGLDKLRILTNFVSPNVYDYSILVIVSHMQMLYLL